MKFFFPVLILFFSISLGMSQTHLAYLAPDEEIRAHLNHFITDPDAIESHIIKVISEYNKEAARLNRNWEIKFSKVDSLDEGALASVTPEVGDKKLIINLQMTPDGLKNVVVAFEELGHLNQIIEDSFPHPYEWTETVANAGAGSLKAKERLARLQKSSVAWARGELKFGEKFTDIDRAKLEQYFKAREARADSVVKDAASAARADFKRREEEWNKTKKDFNELEKAPVKFNELVSRNDRKGAKDMLEKYLPWPLMEPSEAAAWKQWLEAIERPDWTNAKVKFRGLDNDILVKNPGGNPGMLSPVLTNNQGNYTRRLRSLTTLREKIGVHAMSPDGAKSPSLLTVMMNHASEPIASPFLSVSNHDIATGFSENRMAALKIDERRLVPNAMALGHLHEREWLVPVVIFPDEVIHFEDAGKGSIERNAFYTKVEQKLGRPLTDTEITESQTKVDDFVNDGYQRVKKLFLNPGKIQGPGGCQVSGKNTFETLNDLLK